MATVDRGKFELVTDQVGVAIFRVEAPGYLDFYSLPFPVFKTLSLPPVTLVPCERRTVLVVGEDGQPLSKVGVRVQIPESGRDFWRALVRTAFSDSSGQAEVLIPKDEMFILSLYRRGFTELLADATSEGPLTLRAAGSKALRWSDPSGEEGAYVGIRVWIGEGEWSASRDDGTTGTEFRIGSTVKKIQWQTEDGRYGSSTITEAQTVIPLPQRRCVKGRVLDASSLDPVPEALVWPGGSPARFVRAGADGRFELCAELEVLNKAVYIAAAGYSEMKSPVETLQGASDILLVEARTLQGRVVEATGEPVADVQIFVTESEELATRDSRGKPGGKANAVSDADGLFFVEAIPLGSKVFVHAYSGESPPSVVPWIAGDEEELEIVLGTRTALRGLVTDAETRIPVSRAVVFLTPVSGSGTGLQVSSDEFGRFEITGLEQSDGPFDIVAMYPGYAPYSEREIDLRGVVDVKTLLSKTRILILVGR